MKEYILLMHGDATHRDAAEDAADWAKYLSALRGSGRFDGGSSIGPGVRLRSGHPVQPADPDITGFIRVRAQSLEDARQFLKGNPVFEAGGTVEVRELPSD